eukprot:2005945-Rhodomonas_salina.3
MTDSPPPASTFLFLSLPLSPSGPAAVQRASPRPCPPRSGERERPASTERISGCRINAVPNAFLLAVPNAFLLAACHTASCTPRLIPPAQPSAQSSLVE